MVAWFVKPVQRNARLKLMRHRFVLSLLNFHQRYLRPLKDHIVANVELTTPIMAKAPGFFNFFMKQPLAQSLGNTR